MTKNKQTNNKQKRKVIKVSITILVFLIVEMLIIVGFSETHFLKGTKIGGVDCSFMTIKNAKAKVEKKLRAETFKLYFTTGETYEISLDEIGVRLDEEDLVKFFNEEHAYWKAERNYDKVVVEPTKVEEQLAEIPQLQEENMYAPQNARIEWDGNQFYIKEHEFGNKIDFQEALQFTLGKLQNCKFDVNFYSITDIYPEVYADDLWVRKEYLNTIVNKSKLYFTLYDGETIILGKETIKTWIVENPEGYTIDIGNGISAFVDALSLRVEEVNSKIYFTPVGLDRIISLECPEEWRPKLIKDELARIIEPVLGGEAEIVLPYDKPFLTETAKFKDRIELDKSRQGVWAFRDLECVLESSCVTGNVAQGYDTPTGVFSVTEMARDGKMTKYGVSEYKYLIAFFGDYCFHDASWRYQFGGEIYKTAGSHGCANMPEEGARLLYENSYLGMLVLVYES